MDVYKRWLKDCRFQELKGLERWEGGGEKGARTSWMKKRGKKKNESEKIRMDGQGKGRKIGKKEVNKERKKEKEGKEERQGREGKPKPNEGRKSQSKQRKKKKKIE